MSKEAEARTRLLAECETRLSNLAQRVLFCEQALRGRADKLVDAEIVRRLTRLKAEVASISLRARHLRDTLPSG